MRARVTMGTHSCRECGNSASDMVQRRACVSFSFSVNQNTASQCRCSSTTFRRCSHATSHKIQPMHMRKRMRTVNQTQCCFMLVFHKLTVPLQAPFRPRAHTQTNCGKTLQYQCRYYTLCAAPCLFVRTFVCACVCLRVCWLCSDEKKEKKKKCKTYFAFYLSKRGHTDSTPTRRLRVKAKFEFNMA